MQPQSFHRVEAVYPNWRGFLRLSSFDNHVLHEGDERKGTYRLDGGTLVVHWDDATSDAFSEYFGRFLHQRLLTELPALERLVAVTLREKMIAATRISVTVPNSNYEVTLRLSSSDIPTFQQIFGDYEYDSPHLPPSADVIVDLGANIGLATVFFGMRYPQARLLAVEPDPGNFAALVANTAALGDRVQRQQAAVWMRDGTINLHTEGEDGASLGAWGGRTSDLAGATSSVTKCYRLDTLLDAAGFATVDMLKMDIEGAELQIFSTGVERWISRVGMIIIETHDRFQPGSEETIRRVIQPVFEELPPVGENLFFRRAKTGGPTA